MKVVLDTNILISSFVFGGKPRIIFELIAVNKTISGITSVALLSELLGILKNKFDYSRKELAKIQEIISENFTIVNPQKIPTTIKNDPFDNRVLAIADLKPVDYILSGDNHLLKLRHYKNIPIITPHKFLDKYN